MPYLCLSVCLPVRVYVWVCQCPSCCKLECHLPPRPPPRLICVCMCERMPASVWLCVYLSICLLVCLSECLHNYVYLANCVYMSLSSVYKCACASVSICLCFRVLVSLFVCLRVCVCVHVHLYVSVSMCMSVHLNTITGIPAQARSSGRARTHRCGEQQSHSPTNHSFSPSLIFLGRRRRRRTPQYQSVEEEHGFTAEVAAVQAAAVGPHAAQAQPLTLPPSLPSGRRRRSALNGAHRQSRWHVALASPAATILPSSSKHQQQQQKQTKNGLGSRLWRRWLLAVAIRTSFLRRQRRWITVQYYARLSLPLAFPLGTGTEHFRNTTGTNYKRRAFEEN